MFPIMDVNNRVIGFGGRVMGDAKPKYLNSPETMVFDKSRNLYGLNFARTTKKPQLLLCEGYMDVIALHQAGFDNAVASLCKKSCDSLVVLIFTDRELCLVAIALRGFAAEAVVTSVLFSFMGYFNGHARTVFVMAQGLAQSFLVRLPVSYFMSIQPDASLTAIGLAAPAATVFGIAVCWVYYRRMNRELRPELL